MLFNSFTFVAFFAVVLLIHHLPLAWRLRKGNLLVASYLFYAAWNPPFVLLLWISTLVDWFAARRIFATRRPAARRGFVLISLAANLGLLGFFKYGNFLLDNFVALMDALGISYQPPQLSIVLPVGISFYTFQSISYTLDVYRGKMAPWDSFLDFGLYVSFFPQLVAGPIVRATHFLPQCVKPRRASGKQMGWGLTLLTIGLFEKVLLADGIFGPFCNRVYSEVASAGCLDAWLGTAAFSGQIFFDFSGYSTCAIGVGLCMGFALPDNFRCPYAAIGFSDFWHRWHISLSTWLRDYLYVPLGGNRRGRARTYVNLMLTMLIGGLWHGASWRFVVWGGLHGLYLCAERPFRRKLEHQAWASRWYAHLLGVLLTYLLVCLTWVVFRAQDLPSALHLVATMLGGAEGPLRIGTLQRVTVLAVTVAMLLGHWLMRNTSHHDVWSKMPWWLRSMLLAVLLTGLAFAPGEDRAFIYFQF